MESFEVIREYPVRGLTEYRTLIYWTPFADPSDPLSRRSSVSHSGRKVLIQDVFWSFGCGELELPPNTKNDESLVGDLSNALSFVRRRSVQSAAP